MTEHQPLLTSLSSNMLEERVFAVGILLREMETYHRTIAQLLNSLHLCCPDEQMAQKISEAQGTANQIAQWVTGELSALLSSPNVENRTLH